MSETVWFRTITTNLALIKPLGHDGGPDTDPAAPWHKLKRESFADTGVSPTELWVLPEHKQDLSRLPDLSTAGAAWIVSRRLADVLRRFDLGDGRLCPVRAVQRDRATPIPGEYFYFAFHNLKRAFLPEQSSKLRPFLEGVWSTRAVLEDGDIACSREALGGAAIWFDPGLYGKVFLSEGLVTGLRDAGLDKCFQGPSVLWRCRIV